MDHRRLPHQLSEDELIDIIEAKEEPLHEQYSETLEEIINYPTMSDDVVAFLSVYSIQPGNDVVVHRMLYELYKLWSKTPVTKGEFSHEVGKYLLIQQRHGKLYYLINKDSMRLTKAAFDLINEKSIDKSKSLPWRKHFESFLNKYEIKSGDYYVESYILYDLYDEYVYGIGKKSPLGEDQFFNMCKVYFLGKRITSNKVTWFGVDESITTVLTQQRLQSLRRNRLLHHGKKENKKKQRKTSSSKTSSKS